MNKEVLEKILEEYTSQEEYLLDTAMKAYQQLIEIRNRKAEIESILNYIKQEKNGKKE